MGWSCVGFVVDAFASFFFQDSFFSRASRCAIMGFSSDFMTGGEVDMFWNCGGGDGIFCCGVGAGV